MPIVDPNDLRDTDISPAQLSAAVAVVPAVSQLQTTVNNFETRITALETPIVW
jgi:hypothetical protein